MLIDTHVLLWMDRDDSALGARARDQLLGAWRDGEVAVSAISFWEAAILAQRGRITLPKPALLWRDDWLAAGLLEIAIDGRIALLASQLEHLHRDPADRFIIATAIEKATALMTADQQILAWNGPLRCLRADI